MSQTLIIGKENKLRDTWGVNLNTYVGTDVIPKSGSKEALELLRVLPTISLIVTLNEIDSAPVAKEIHKYLMDNNLDIPLIIMGNEPDLDDFAIIIESETDVRSLVKLAAKQLGVTAKQMADKIVPDFFPIPISYFLGIDTANCDVYVRVKKEDKSYQYIKRFKAKDHWPSDDILTYKEKGIDCLYVPADYRLSFVNEVTQAVIAKLNDKTLSNDERIKVSEFGMNLLKEETLLKGISENTISLAKASINAIIATSQKYPHIDGLVQDLLKNKTGYLFHHCQLITYVSFYIIDHIDWGTSEQKHKLSFVAFFHDIVLTSEQQAKVRSEEELFRSKLSSMEREKVSKHAQSAAALVTEIDNAPIGADIIIKQHHGKRNGIGFTNFYGSNISPLAIVFIVAEEYVESLLEQGPDHFDHQKSIKTLRLKYKSSSYKKVIESLEDLQIS